MLSLSTRSKKVVNKERIITMKYTKEYLTDNKVAISLRTQKECDKAMALFEKWGIVWGNGKKPTKWNCWKDHEEETCVDLYGYSGEFSYCDKAWYEGEGYEVITAEEFLANKELTLEESTEELRKLNEREHINKEETMQFITSDTKELRKQWNKMVDDNKFMSAPTEFYILLWHLKQIRANTSKKVEVKK